MSGISNFFSKMLGGSKSPPPPSRMPGSGLSINNGKVTIGENYTGCYDVNGNKGCYKDGKLVDSYEATQQDEQIDAANKLRDAARKKLWDTGNSGPASKIKTTGSGNVTITGNGNSVIIGN